MNWEGSPQFQKHLQKIRSLSPEKRAVTQGLIDELYGAYAGADMRKQLDAMRSAAYNEDMENRIANQTRRLDMADRALGHDESMNKHAEALGYINMPLSALAGYEDYKHKKSLTDLYKQLREKI